jgi:hypothetical protein
MYVEMPTMFVAVDSGGEMALENHIFKLRNAVFRVQEDPFTPVRAGEFVRRHMEPSATEYAVGTLDDFRAVVQSISQDPGLDDSLGYGTISLCKAGLQHSIGFIVHFVSGHVEFFDARGCNLMHPNQRQERRGYYTPEAFRSLQERIITDLFQPAPDIVFRVQQMDPDFECLLHQPGVCRLAVLTYLAMRMQRPMAEQASLYRDLIALFTWRFHEDELI